MNSSYKIFILFSLLAFSEAYKIKARIIKGASAKPDQFPFYAFLDIKDIVPNQGGICGGAIISDQWIVTAAHCIYAAGNVTIKLGKSASNQLDASDSQHSQIIMVGRDDFYIHPHYVQNSSNMNDIALIRLPCKVHFTTNIQPVKLPTKCKAAENVSAIAMGMGETGEDALPKQLRFVFLKTLPSNVCHQTFDKLSTVRSIICASDGVDGGSICGGDSGGPLVTQKDRTLIGIASFVRENCNQGEPQGFTNVIFFLDWISKITHLKVPKCQSNI